jgi:transposase
MENARNLARRTLPAELPRDTETLQPKETGCPDCGGNLTNHAKMSLKHRNTPRALERHSHRAAEVKLHTM